MVYVGQLSSFSLTSIFSLGMELAASMALGHLCMNLVMESPGCRWKVPTPPPPLTDMPLPWFHLVPLASTTSWKPWNFTFWSGSRIFCNGRKSCGCHKSRFSNRILPGG